MLFYDSVLTNTINDNLKAKSHLGKAVIYFNNDKVDDAISEYKFVVENFQNGSYFKQALLGKKAIYVGIAKVDEYISFIITIAMITFTKPKTVLANARVAKLSCAHSSILTLLLIIPSP